MKSTIINNNPLLFGKIPPEAKEMEMTILGAIMLDSSAYERASAILKPESFYLDAHKRIFAVMKSLSDRYQPLDLMTMFEELKKTDDLDKIGGAHYLSLLTNSVTSSAGIENNCHVVLEKYLKRELIKHAGAILNHAYDNTTDVFELIDKTEQSFSRINDNFAFGDMISIEQVMRETINQVYIWKELGGQTVTGCPTGFNTLNESTRGWQDTNLIYIAARPSVGKTAFSLSLVRAAAEHYGLKKQTVAVWSLEMSRIQLGLRMLSAESNTMLTRLQTGKLEDKDLSGYILEASSRLSNMNIKFDDTAGLNIPKLRSKARKLKRKNNLGIIFIDYLQLIEGETRGNREQEISGISRKLKLLAKELNIPIIALAQLSREVEKRPGGIPNLSDLRESGSIEQDADVVLMLYGESDAAISEEPAKERIKYVKIAKQRDGMLVTIPLDFDRYTQRFTEPTAEIFDSKWRPMSDPDKFISSSKD